jgi:hypothetical protein
MQQFARIRTKDSIVPVILKGEQPWTCVGSFPTSLRMAAWRWN